MTFYAVRPVPAPRMTRADVWKERPCVLEYRDFKDQLRAVFSDGATAVLLGPVRVTFHLPVPQSWSPHKKVGAHGKPCLSKPDVDNLTKALLDAALPKGDQCVWSLHAVKLWTATTPGIDIEALPWT